MDQLIRRGWVWQRERTPSDSALLKSAEMCSEVEDGASVGVVAGVSVTERAVGDQIVDEKGAFVGNGVMLADQGQRIANVAVTAGWGVESVGEWRLWGGTLQVAGRTGTEVRCYKSIWKEGWRTAIPMPTAVLSVLAGESSASAARIAAVEEVRELCHQAWPPARESRPGPRVWHIAHSIHHAPVLHAQLPNFAESWPYSTFKYYLMASIKTPILST